MAFPTGWAKKCIITIPDARISGSNTDFSILLTEDNFPVEMLDGGAASALNGGGDVRFSEDSAGLIQLPCEIVSFVTGGTPSAEVHVKLSALNTGADKIFYVWYNKAGEVQPLVTDPFGRNAVYTTEKARYRLQEAGASEGNLTGGTSYDSTKAGTIVADTVNKVFGASSANLNNSGYYDIADDPFAGATSFAIRTFLRSTGSASDGVIGNWQGNTNMSVLLFTGSNDKVYLRVRNTGGVVTTIISTTLIQAQTGTPWHYVSARYDGANIYLDVDGVNEASAAFTGTIDTAATNNPEIGRYNGANTWGGNLQELSLADSGLSLNWVITEYNNLNTPSAFAIAGTPEAVSGGDMLAVNSAVSIHRAGNANLNQAQSLTAQNAHHIQTPDNTTLTQQQSIAADSADHMQAADNVIIAQSQSLIVAGAGHELASDSPAQTQGNTSIVNNSSHAVASGQTAIDQFVALVTQKATHGLSSDVASLFDPAGFTLNTLRMQRAERENRQILNSGEHRIIHPINTRN